MVFDHSQRTTASQARRNRLKRFFDFRRLKNRKRRVPYKSPIRENYNDAKRGSDNDRTD